MKKQNLIKEGERLDDLQRDGLFLIQDPKKFCFGIDAVLLSHYTVTRKRDKVLDLCTGNGIIPTLLSALSEDAEFTGIELQEECADLANRSVIYNSLEDKIKIINADLKNYKEIFEHDTFNVVTCNPPYMTVEEGVKNDSDPLKIARHEIMCTLDDVISAASYCLKVRGRFYMIHRPGRLPEIFETMKKHHLEPKRMRLVHPYIDKEANMVLIEGVKCGNKGIKVEMPLAVYKRSGEYTEEINKMMG